MKTLNTIKSSTLLALLLISIFAQAQTNTSEISDEYYVVVGAFRIERNAINFTQSLEDKGYEAVYKLNNIHQLNYVYTFKSKGFSAAKESLFTLRDQYPDMDDSWLYLGNLESDNVYSNTPITSTSNITDEAVDTAASMVEETSSMAEEVDENIQDTESNATEIAEEAEQSTTAVEEAVEEVQEKPVIIEEPGTFRVYLNTTNAKNQREVVADFKVIDLEREKELSPIKSHEVVRVRPKNGTNRVKFVSNIIGYKIEEQIIDLDEPLKEPNSKIEVNEGTISIDLELSKYKKGDFAVLWKVFFYKDAAIMREESVYELTQLLNMMKEDEKMKIKIHGHTNGNSFGKVLHLDLDDKQFFSLNGSHNEDNASAKKLSEYRAYTIQHWLIDQGVSEDRMEIQGWGGKKMLHDKHDDKAHQNVRVEIEVTETS